MDIVNNLRGKLAVGLYVMAGCIIGILFLRGGIFFILGLLAIFCSVLLVRYPVLGILSIVGGTSLLDFHQGLPLTKIGTIHIPDLVLFLLLVVAVFRRVFLGVNRIRTPLDIPVIIFVLIGAAILLTGFFEKKYLFFVGIKEFKPVLYYLVTILVTNMIKDKRSLKVVICGCLALGVIAAIRVILTGSGKGPMALGDAEEAFYRFSRVSGSVSMLPFWSLVAFVSLMLMSKVRSGFILGAGIILIWLILSFTRHFWIAFVVSFLCVLLFNSVSARKRIVVFSFLILICMSLVAAASLSGVEPVASYVRLVGLRAGTLTFQKAVANWDYRMTEREYALRTIRNHPFFGIGFHSPYRPAIFGSNDTTEAYVHNGYSWILIKLGLVGLIPFLWFSFVFVRRGIMYRNRVRDNFLRAVVLASVCSYLGIAVGNVAAPHFMENWEVSVIGLTMGINEVIYRLEGVGAGR